jgi:hypothetical protein
VENETIEFQISKSKEQKMQIPNRFLVSQCVVVVTAQRTKEQQTYLGMLHSFWMRELNFSVSGNILCELSDKTRNKKIRCIYLRVCEEFEIFRFCLA